MKRLLYLSLLFSFSVRAADTCDAPKFCLKIQSTFERLQKDSSRKSFDQFLSLLKQASKKSCRIQGVKVFIPGYRACYDNGFTTKLDSKGQPVLDKTFPGTMTEDTVLGWFNFVANSQYSEGKKFTRSKLFQSTLDGAWAEQFSDQ